VPGNIAQIAGRTSLSLREGIKLRTFTVSLVYETVLAAAASIIVGLGLYLLSPTSLMHLPGAKSWVVLGIAAPTPCALILLVFGAALLPTRIRAHARISALLTVVASPRPGVTAAILVAYCANYLLIGVGIWCIGLALGIAPPRSYALLTGAFSLAWLLGYV